MDFFQCISLPEGLRRIEQATESWQPRCETVPLSEACGRIAAASVAAAEQLPAFSRSTVDGYAVAGADTFGAAEGLPALLEVGGEVRMGEAVFCRAGVGRAVAVPTGGMLPPGADAVVMLEHTERADTQSIMVLKPAAPGDNVVRAGDDISVGAQIIAAGQRIAPQDVGALAACGITELAVYERPTVGVLSTGDEIVDPAVRPQIGQIRDVNGPALAALLEEAGCRVIRYGIVRDDAAALAALLRQAATECRIVVLSGGSSVGARDHTVDVLQELAECPVLFHGLAMKPGKPAIFAVVQKSAIFGLPGHPVAALTVCRQLVLPVAARLAGRTPNTETAVRARMLRNIASAAGRDDFIKVRLTKDDNGYLAEPVLGKSGLIFTMTQADGEVHISADKTGLYEAEEVTVRLLRSRND